MSSFVVIGAHNKLVGLVDGINKSRPLNPNVHSLISLGELIGEEDGLYYKHTLAIDESVQNKEDARDLEDVLRNQLAQIRKEALLGDRLLNVFLLENPISEEEESEVDLVYNCLQNIYDSKQDVNIRLIRVCFSYDIEHPEDVSKAIPIEYIQKRKNKLSDEFPQNLFLIDNQDRFAAAICVNKRSHDLMIERMLCDFMMVISNENDSYNMGNAIISDTKVFSMGFAELYYYFEDVKRFFQIANKRDLNEVMLVSEIDSQNESLDIDTHPFGLNERVERLGKIYEKVSFVEKIENFPLSMDKTIDDVIISLRPHIESFRNKLIIEAQERDRENENEHSELEEGTKARKSEVEKVLVNYPEYIDRRMIYNKCLILGEDLTDDDIDAETKQYEKWLQIIQKQDFREYLTFVASTPTVVGDDFSEGKASSCNPEENSNRGCLLSLLSIFKNRKRKEHSNALIEVESELSLTKAINIESILKPINKIIELNKQRRAYMIFKENVNEVKAELNVLDQQLDSFKLTKHCKTVGVLIDLGELTKEQILKKEEIISKTKRKWNNLSMDKRSKTTLIKINEEETNSLVSQYQYVDWNNPFSFIDTHYASLDQVIELLQRKSAPFVHYNAIRDVRENLICKHVYSDNPQYIVPIKDRDIDVRDKNSLLGIESKHIASKICMMQIFQMDNIAYKGLVDFNDEEI